jgi:hypothetical protein
VLVHGAACAVGQALLALGSMAGLELWGSAHGDHAALVRNLATVLVPMFRAGTLKTACVCELGSSINARPQRRPRLVASAIALVHGSGATDAVAMVQPCLTREGARNAPLECGADWMSLEIRESVVVQGSDANDNQKTGSRPPPANV